MTVHYTVTDVTAPWQGEPETIVFHHGVGITSDIWLEWLAPLADRYRLVRIDCRGFGRSPVPPPGFPWSMAGLADDVLEVARAVGVDRFHYVGESLGGTLGLFLAVHHPAAVRSLALCSTAHRGGSIQRVHEWRAYIARHGMGAWSRMMMDLRMAPGVPVAMREWFDESPFIPLSMALELHARIPRSEIRIFPGARHALAHTHAAACASALREFLGRRLGA